MLKIVMKNLALLWLFNTIWWLLLFGPGAACTNWSSYRHCRHYQYHQKLRENYELVTEKKENLERKV